MERGQSLESSHGQLLHPVDAKMTKKKAHQEMGVVPKWGLLKDYKPQMVLMHLRLRSNVTCLEGVRKEVKKRKEKRKRFVFSTYDDKGKESTEEVGIKDLAVF